MNEEELDEELKKLNVKEDFGEDSDLTPTNSPVPRIPLQNSCLPHSSNTSGFFDGDFTKFSSYEDSALLSGSSLSWGEDEFEGEATRTVTVLFDQLDELIYRDAKERSVKFPNIKSRKYIKPAQKAKSKAQPKKKEQETEIIISESLTPGEVSEDESLDTERLSSINVPPAPSSSLIAECKDWIDNFPQLRIIGIGIDLSQYEKIESRLLPSEDESEDSEEEESSSEEIFSLHGDYESKLQFRVLKAEVNKEKKKDKAKVPSRICSGSSDPEVLKEHVLINVFENVWPRLCQIIEPLFTKYAEWLEAQTAQCVSSKGMSAVNENRRTEFPDISALKELKKHKEISSHSYSYSLPSVIRPPLSRPSSAMYRIPEKVPTQLNNSNGRRGLNQIIEYYVNPIHLSEENIPSRSSSASKTRELSLSSTTSLPYLVSSRPTSRPLSSISGNRHHLLTPMRTVEPRPQSTSSSGRLRYREKIKIDQSKIVEEKKSQLDEIEAPSPPWSRHTPFLPQINVDAKNQIKNSTSPTPSISYAKSLAAIARSGKTWNDGVRKDVTIEAEPFVSWIVSRVEKQHSSKGEKEKSQPSPVKGKSDKTKENATKANSLPLGGSKYTRRLSHH
ncbi:UNVERIFIED_CONTAM: hypothetical protein RMT77_013334 [Armadillidium vulgare]